ncbi:MULTISPECIES: ABC transporter ATP-binding protein [unclassified Mycoplasma]|uniref:ABC transporter ATP-binding protein n=1 Tax=unclassified Mycoplasma TaxID=2683645 RepID=UPI00216AC939|nr:MULTISPECIES: ABC transporter ATP-binding protein [unclassified Mycoplasma]MCS4536812.1 ABC transporter ATP-binding protein [Mycoplasma sp. CSL7475-4]MCT4469920.1 ABC transporter ATP-binding protein [Mycoplasma sp. HS2188]
MDNQIENLDKKNIIVIEKLFKKFKKFVALKEISFSVKKGELFGFLGLNGAGKTTTLNIILGLLKRDGGNVYINSQSIDKDITKVRNEIGIVFQESILDPSLTVWENLKIRASLYKNFFKDRKIDDVVREIVDEFQLSDFVKRPYGKLSGGQRRRVDIARALVHRPSILFLDEPTTGLDPNSRKLVWEILKNIQKQRHLTILLTTHYMEEADDCSRAIIIQKGKKLVEGTPAELKKLYSSSTVLLHSISERLRNKIKESNLNFNYKNSSIIIKFDTFKQGHEFVKNNIDDIEDYEFIKGSMDEVFLNVTKQFGGDND